MKRELMSKKRTLPSNEVDIDVLVENSKLKEKVKSMEKELVEKNKLHRIYIDNVDRLEELKGFSSVRDKSAAKYFPCSKYKNQKIAQSLFKTNWYFYSVSREGNLDYKLEFRVQYYGSEELPKICFHILDGKYFKTSIAKNLENLNDEGSKIERKIRKKYSFEIDIKVKSGIFIRDWIDLPKTIIAVSENDVNGDKIGTIHVDNHVHELAYPTLKQISVKHTNLWDNYNILLFGIAGSGKSSYINSIFTFLSKTNELCHIASSYGGVEHGTVEYKMYKLPDINVNIIDVWGISTSNYKCQDVEAIARGFIDDGWNMDDDFKKKEGQLRKMIKTSTKRRVHSVVFFVPYSILEDTELLKKCKNTFSVLRKFVKNPFIMIPMVDKLSKEAKKNPLNWRNGDEEDVKTMKDAINSIRREFGANNDSILLGRNYFEENQKSYFIDLNNYYTFDKLVKQAQVNENFMVKKNDFQKDFDIKKFLKKCQKK